LATPTALQLAITTAWSRSVLRPRNHQVRIHAKWCVPDSRRGISSCRSHCTNQCVVAITERSQTPREQARISQLAGKLEVTNWQFSFGCGLSCSVLVSTYPMVAGPVGRTDRSEARGWTSELLRQVRPSPPSPAFHRIALHRPPPHMHGRGGTPSLGVVGEPAAGRTSVRTPRGWLVGAGSGRVPGPKLAAGTAASATCRISGSLGGPELR
jgi:hypothetical protein